MRVLIWSFRLIPTQGGHELLVRDVANGLVARGHTIRIVGPAVAAGTDLHTQSVGDAGCGREVTVDRLAIHRALERRDLGALLRLRHAIARIVETFDPDVIHMHGTGPDAFLYLSSPESVRAVPMMYTSHGMAEEFRVGEGSVSKVLDLAARATAVSDSTRRELFSWSPAAAPKTSVVHNGVQSIPNPLPPEPGANRFLSASRLAPEKGLGVLLTAFSLLVKRVPDATLVLAGDGPLRSQLAWLADHLGVADRVQFPGWLDRSALQDEFRRSTAVVVPSTWAEPFGLIAAEAGGAGRPVIASRVGGLPEIIAHNGTGLLFQTGDIVALAGAMSRLINEPDTAEAFGRAAHQRVSEHFSLTGCIESYERLLLETAELKR